MRAISEDFFMLQSRRGFLIGAGAVLTTAFVKDARSFIHRNSQPLLASPTQVVETMYWYEIQTRATSSHSVSGPTRHLHRHGESFSLTKVSRTGPRVTSRKSATGTSSS